MGSLKRNRIKKQIFEEKTVLHRARNPAFTAFRGFSFPIPEITDTHDIRVGTTISVWISALNFAAMEVLTIQTCFGFDETYHFPNNREATIL